MILQYFFKKINDISLKNIFLLIFYKRLCKPHKKDYVNRVGLANYLAIYCDIRKIRNNILCFDKINTFFKKSVFYAFCYFLIITPTIVPAKEKNIVKTIFKMLLVPSSI